MCMAVFFYFLIWNVYGCFFWLFFFYFLTNLANGVDLLSRCYNKHHNWKITGRSQYSAGYIPMQICICSYNTMKYEMQHFSHDIQKKYDYNRLKSMWSFHVWPLGFCTWVDHSLSWPKLYIWDNWADPDTLLQKINQRKFYWWNSTEILLVK